MMYELTKLIMSLFEKKPHVSKLTREQKAMERYLSQAEDHIELEYRYKQWDKMNTYPGSLWRV
jgi:hypothetical protein